MRQENSFWTIKIRKRAWYVWLGRIVWLVWLIFWAEVAVGSWQEMEQQAFIISLVIFLLSLFLGLLLWLVGFVRYKKTKV